MYYCVGRKWWRLYWGVELLVSWLFGVCTAFLITYCELERREVLLTFLSFTLGYLEVGTVFLITYWPKEIWKWLDFIFAHIHVITYNYYNGDLEFTSLQRWLRAMSWSCCRFFAWVGRIGFCDVLSAGLGLLLGFCAERRIIGPTWEDARNWRSSRLVRPHWCGWGWHGWLLTGNWNRYWLQGLALRASQVSGVSRARGVQLY